MRRVYNGVRSPSTPEEWQEAVNGASFFLSLDSARQYGLLTGGPVVNAERCQKLLRRGRALGYFPLPFEQLAPLYLPALVE